MTNVRHAQLAAIRTFRSLIKYLRDEMDWPIGADSFEDLTFDYSAEELGIDASNAAKIEEIKRLRPLASGQPWGIFFVKFEPKRLPVVALRRILSQVVLKKRATAKAAEHAAWAADDLLFVSNYGEGDARHITFAHFSQSADRPDLPTLKVLGWDNLDTPLHISDVADRLTRDLAWPDDPDDAKSWRLAWRAAFTLGHREVVTTSQDLSVRLAELARAIRDRIRAAMAIETDKGPLKMLMKAFQDTLLHDLDSADFADMYAQTIAYGLLSSRIADPKSRTADDFAAHMRTNPFLRELMQTFLHIGGRRGKGGGPGIDFDELGVSDVMDLLDRANMEAVVRDFGDRNPLEDPVIHFYELFLAEYDAEKRMRRGVFYTPRPVVSFIVRSVDEVLRTELGLPDGLADITSWAEMVQRHRSLTIPEGTPPDQPFVQILDPATGTGTFLVEVIGLIHQTMTAKWTAAGKRDTQIALLWDAYVTKHLLPRLHGYELLMAPYAIAHLKIGLKLYETGYRFSSNERARIYLTNALEPASDLGQHRLTGIVPALAHEAQAVNEIKRTQRFTVVIGNPPYNSRSENRTQWIMDQIELYKTKVRHEETQIQALSDDYVKFIRFSDWSISRSGIGVIGMITNNGYLDGHIFSDLRSHIIENYTKIQTVNLHGDARKRERTPDGNSDKNVFDIMQGVAILILAKGLESGRSRRVMYLDMWGDQDTKYDLLTNNELDKSWVQTSAVAAKKSFIPLQNSTTDWDAALQLPECFGTGRWQEDKTFSYGSGFKSQQDEFALAFTRDEIVQNIKMLLQPRMTESILRQQFSLCNTNQWSFSRARERLGKSNWESQIQRVLFRPFDFRFSILTADVVTNPRREIMSQMERPNLALLATRKSTEGFAAFVANVPCGHKIVGNYDMTTVFPAYRYENGAGKLALSSLSKNSNLSPNLTAQMKIASRGSRSPAEDFIRFAYAVFYSPGYRERNAESLRNDFPRVPLPKAPQLFHDLKMIGGKLVALHLMESPTLENLNTSYTGPEDPEVGRIAWSDETVWLDATAKSQRTDLDTIGFHDVSEAVWNFRIGSYKICEKWLKDRKGRTLSTDDIAHFQKSLRPSHKPFA